MGIEIVETARMKTVAPLEVSLSVHSCICLYGLYVCIDRIVWAENQQATHIREE